MWPFTKPEKKSLPSNFSAFILFGENVNGGNSTSFRTLAKQGYSGNTSVYASINEISGSVAGLDWKVTNLEGEVQPNTPLAKLLAHPNEKQTNFGKFIQSQMNYKLIDGNSFILASGMTEDMDRTGELVGQPGILEIIEPDRVEVKKDDDGDVSGYRIARTSKSGDNLGQVFPRDRVWQSLMFNPLDQDRGMSPMEPSTLDWSSNTESKRWNFSLLKRGGRPSGVLSVNKSLDKEDIQRIRQDADQRFGGSDNAGKMMVLQNVDGGMEWIETSTTPKDADWVKGMQAQERNISKAYQVPSEMLNDGSNKTYSNYNEARKAFYTETVVPHAKEIKAELNEFLLDKFNAVGQLIITFDESKIEALQEDQQIRRQEIRVGYGLGLAFPNEWRKEMGFEDLDDDDNVRVIPLNLVPAETLTIPPDEVNENDPPKD